MFAGCVSGCVSWWLRMRVAFALRPLERQARVRHKEAGMDTWAQCREQLLQQARKEMWLGTTGWIDPRPRSYVMLETKA